MQKITIKNVTQIKKIPKIFDFTNSQFLGLAGLCQTNNYIKMSL